MLKLIKITEGLHITNEAITNSHWGAFWEHMPRKVWQHTLGVVLKAGWDGGIPCSTYKRKVTEIRCAGLEPMLRTVIASALAEHPEGIMMDIGRGEVRQSPRSEVIRPTGCKNYYNREYLQGFADLPNVTLWEHGGHAIAKQSGSVVGTVINAVITKEA